MIVTRYVSERTVEVFRLSTDSRHDFAREPSGDCQTPITIIIPDPPKPLEATGVHSDSENCTCVPSPRCAAISQTKLNCRPVTLVEKEPK